MTDRRDEADPAAVAREIDRRIRALPVRNARSVGALRRAFSDRLARCSGAYVLAVARSLVHEHGHRGWVSYDLVRRHRAAFACLDRAALEELGRGIDSWGATDSFARQLAGPAWVRGQIALEDVLAWAGSPDRWWRRAALVAIVGLNSRTSGGTGDAARTLAVCERLIDDRDDMVVKAMSWALRELLAFDREAVVGFLADHEARLAARVKREVRYKLETGLKAPRRRSRPPAGGRTGPDP